MNDHDNYAVIGLSHYNEMRDRLAVLEYENANLRTSLDSAVAKHLEIQQRITENEEQEDTQ